MRSVKISKIKNSPAHLVVRDDDHDDAGLQGDELVQSLHVGGGPVVSDGDNFGWSELHAEGRSSLLQTLDELLRHCAIPLIRN